MISTLTMFCILIVIISILGIAGNVRFLFINWREEHIHKRLLVFMTVLHIPYCIILILDAIRVFIGISLTRSSCLRFTGAISSLLSLSQSLLHSFIGIELILLISAPLWFRHLKAWWFQVPVFFGFFFSGYLIYMSWNSEEEDVYVVLCAPQTALATHFLYLGNTFIFVNNIIVSALYATLLVLLIAKKSKLRDEVTKRFIVSSAIIAVVFAFSWFANIAIIRYAMPISEFFGVEPSAVNTFATLPAVLTFSTTHYVYFFVSSKNRKSFRRRGALDKMTSCRLLICLLLLAILAVNATLHERAEALRRKQRSDDDYIAIDTVRKTGSTPPSDSLRTFAEGKYHPFFRLHSPDSGSMMSAGFIFVAAAALVVIQQRCVRKPQSTLPEAVIV